MHLGLRTTRPFVALSDNAECPVRDVDDPGPARHGLFAVRGSIRPHPA